MKTNKAIGEPNETNNNNKNWENQKLNRMKRKQKPETEHRKNNQTIAWPGSAKQDCD